MKALIIMAVLCAACASHQVSTYRIQDKTRDQWAKDTIDAYLGADPRYPAYGGYAEICEQEQLWESADDDVVKACDIVSEDDSEPVAAFQGGHE